MLRLVKNTGFRQGEIVLPTSKSLSNRALIIRELCKTPFDINELSPSDDTQNLLEQLRSVLPEMNIGAAGTNMRFLISLLSISDTTRILTGSERMLKRPVKELVDALKNLGAQIGYMQEEGYPPLKIVGKELKGGNIRVDGSISSQFISSLLMIAPRMKQGLCIEITGKMVSVPYIRMTLEMMRYFGIHWTWDQTTITVPPQEYSGRKYTVEGDWSAAGFWYGFIACSAEGTSLTLPNISLDSWQGDKATAGHYAKLGITTGPLSQGGIQLTRQGGMYTNDLHFHLINEPDLFPALAFTCATLRVRASFSGLETLNLKESKRIETIAGEIGKTGALTEITDHSLKISGYSVPSQELTFDTFYDHRIAMAAAIYTMHGEPICIRNPEVVSKSYPGFWKDLKNIAIVNIY